MQTWGRPETSGARLFLNSGLDLTENAQFYVHGNYADTDGRYRFFYRPGATATVGSRHSTLTALEPLGLTGSILETGYTPFLDGAQQDYSAVAGVKGDLDNGLIYDLSAGYGRNELNYFLNNSINTSLGVVGGAPAQLDFDMGGFQQEEINLNADFSYAVNDRVNFAFGAEWREEQFTTIAGETAATTGVGPSGMSAVTPADAGSFSRDNYAAYIDIEHDITDRLMLQYAVRYEDFSDFGSTFNYKVAGRYAISDTVNFRGAISTGFHAPTPGQANVSTIITTFDGATGLQVEEGLIPATSADAIAAGGRPLTEEQANNLSFGITADLTERTTLVVDVYRINVDDRIYRTGDIQLDAGLPSERTISFYTNALDTRSKGIDVVLTSGFDWNDEVTTDFTFAANYNDFDVTGQRSFLVGGNTVTPVSDATVEDIENNFPSFRFVATANTAFNEKWDLLTRINYYGSHFDERGTIQANPELGGSAEIGATVYVDLEVGYQATEALRIVAGAANLFNTFVDELGPPNDNRLSVGLQYPRRSAANYEGGSWYVRASYSF